MNITEILPGISKLEIPLPKTPLKATNSYFIRGRDRDLLIDTAFNHELCREAMTEAMERLGIDMARTDLFVTHLHSDHAGLSQFLKRDGTRIFMSRADGTVVGAGRDAAFWDSFKNFYHFTGLYAGGHVTDVAQHPGFAYAPAAADDILFVEDGHRFDVGEYSLVTVLTPGHTRGHFCLYEPEKKLLFSGDHILGKITPNITQMSFDHDALGEFLGSLGRIERLDVDVVLPGHRHSVEDCRGRIEQLRRHHDKRLEEVMTLVGDKTATTVDVARGMRWSLTYDNWDEYPPAQKLFSAGEALAHLHYLELRGRLVREANADGVVTFRRGVS